jgi:Cellulase (glycosyl hydrolase family 5)
MRRWCLLIVGFIGLSVGLAATPAPAVAGSPVARGLCDIDLPFMSPAARLPVMNELGAQLHVKYLRLVFDWSAAEPKRGHFDKQYFDTFSSMVDEARAQGMQVILTVYTTPRWASNRSLWKHPPFGFKKNRYYSFYAMSTKRLPDFRGLAYHLAKQLKGRVFGYECWNEPNLWPFIYPQKIHSWDNFAAQLYSKMLRSFFRGIRAADPQAEVIAGATAPLGYFDRFRTSPQRFAAVLKSNGAERYFDAYSHHPYMPGGSPNVAPDARPGHPTTTVSLQNLGTLLRIFPDKPFYLTEYGYNTSYSVAFGATTISKTRQAEYLQKAYAYAARYPQVKMLVWFLRKDWSPSGSPHDPMGVYTGLRSLNGQAKRSWFAFAGDTALTISGPTSSSAGAQVKLTGSLSSPALGGLGHKQLQLQTRTGQAWKTLKSCRTDSNGNVQVFVHPSATTAYRLCWRGVVTSGSHSISVN